MHRASAFHFASAILAVTFGVLIATSQVTVLDSAAMLGVGALVAVGGLVIGVRRSRAEYGYVDIFHPLIFPLGYVAVTFLAPAWAMLVTGRNFLGFTSSVMAPNTALLMTLAVTGVTLGLAVKFPCREHNPATAPDPRFLTHVGRIVLLLLVAIAAQGYLTGSVLTRGVGQTTYGAAETVQALMTILTPLAVVLLASAHRATTPKGLLRPVDWVLLVGLICFLGLGGGRGQGITVLLVLVYGGTRKRIRTGALAASFGAILAFAVGVLQYRGIARGGSPSSSTSIALLTDWSVATYTTGITAQGVPSKMDFQWGSTYLASALRQLPSPVANRILGQPYDTGTYAFRRLIAFENPNQGWAYSLPAEGYLNFGVAGMIAACFLFGLFMAWAWSRASWPAPGVTALVYPVLMAFLPVALRSDALGLIKSVLYPVLIATAIYAVARAAQHRLPERRPMSRLASGRRRPGFPDASGVAITPQ